MTEWAAPAIEAEAFGKFVPCDWSRAEGALSAAIIGPIGLGAPIVVRYIRGDSVAARELAKSLRDAGYTNVRVRRGKP